MGFVAFLTVEKRSDMCAGFMKTIHQSISVKAAKILKSKSQGYGFKDSTSLFLQRLLDPAEI